MKRLLAPAALPLALLLAPPPAAAQPAAAVDVTFEVGATKGALMIALFDSEQAYQARKPLQGVRLPADASRVKARFEGLKPGRYAVQAFHDLDDDGGMNTNLMGLPTEPFAFSNNAPPRGGPASWSAASFEVPQTGAVQTITLR